MLSTAPPSGVAFAVCMLLAAALFAVDRAGSPRRERSASASTPSMLSGIGGNRIAVSLTAAFLVLLATRWVMLAVLVGVLVVVWNRLLRDTRAEDERQRIEGIAKWLEDLRDTLRGSAIGAEEALEQVALRPPVALTEPLRSFTDRKSVV